MKTRFSLYSAAAPVVSRTILKLARGLLAALYAGFAEPGSGRYFGLLVHIDGGDR